MRNIISGVLVGVIAFVVLAPVIAWIMPKPEDAGGNDHGAAGDADGGNPFVPSTDPTGQAEPQKRPTDRDEAPARPAEAGERKAGLVTLRLAGDGDGRDGDDDHHDEAKDDDRREHRKKGKHWRGD